MNHAKLREWGYSLVELLVVCGLIGSVISMGFSALNPIADAQRLTLAVESFVTAVTGARFQAVAKNLAVQILVHPSRREFALVLRGSKPRMWQPLPQGTEFSKVPRRWPTFYSRGFASPAGTFVLANRSDQIRVIISLSGRVRWERMD